MGFEIFAKKSDNDVPTSSDGDLPYLFENWLRFFKKEVNRQCLKSYLHSSTRGNSAHIEALVTVLLRDYVRDLWRREGTERIGGSSADSLNRPLHDDGDNSLGELLAGSDPEPGQEAELAELDDIGLECAKSFYPGLTADERLLLGGRASGRGPSHPEILAKASVGQSVLYEKEKGIEEKLDAYLRKQFRNDLRHEPRMLDLLTRYTGKHLLIIAHSDFFPEKTKT